MGHTLIRKITRAIRRYRVLLGLILVGGALYPFREPLVHRLSEIRTERQFTEARQLASENRWKEALRETREIGGRMGNHLPLLRLRIEAAVKSGERVQGDLLTGYFVHPEATEEDRSWILGLVLSAGDTVLFSQFYNLLPDDEKERRGIALQKGRFLTMLDRTEEAVGFARELLNRWPGDEGCQFFLAEVLLRRGQGQDYDEGQELAHALLSSATFPVTSKRVLASLPWLIPLEHWNPEKWQPARTILAGFPDRTVSESLFLYSLEAPDETAPRFDPWTIEVAASFWSEDPVAVADWFLFLKKPKLALAQWSPDPSQVSLASFQKHLDLLIEAGQWGEAEKWLEESPATVESVRLWLARARIAEKLGEGARWRSCLEHAFFAADLVASENFYFLICGEALRSGEVELASRAALQGIHHPMAIIPPAAYFEEIIGHLWTSGRVADLETLLGVLHRREPEEPRVFNNFLYVRLLGEFESMGEEARSNSFFSPRSLHSIVALARQHPSEDVYGTTAALHLWWAEMPEDGLRLLQEAPQRSPLGHTIQGLLHLELGEKDQARAAYQRVSREDLLPIEREVFLQRLEQELQLNAEEEPAPENPSLPQKFRFRSGAASN